MELINFCTRNVEVIDAEADQYQMIALYNVTDIPLMVYNITNSNDDKVFIMKLPEDGKH